LQQEIADISSVEKIFDLSENTTSINYYGDNIEVKWLEGHHSKHTLYRTRFALLNQKVLIVSSSGYPSPMDIKDVAFKLITMHQRLKLSEIDLVWDMRSIMVPSLKVRRQFVHLNNLLEEFWSTRYLVFSPVYKYFIKAYKFIYQPKIKNLFFVHSIKEALVSILSENEKISPNAVIPNDPLPDRETLSKKSKAELIDIIEHYQIDHQKTSDRILEAMRQISWGGRFKKADFDVSKQSSNLELLNTFSLLQNDLAEIIKEYKELNLNLELKVAERIVDFIDKESNLRSILDNSDRLTCLLNSRFELMDFNTAFSNEIRKKYGITPKVDLNILDIFPDDQQREVWRERIQSAINGKAGIFLDQNIGTETGQVLEIKTFPIKEIGKIKGVSVFIEDITELKNSQFKLIEKNRDLQKVNSELDSFVYRVSHDLRAPLTSILGLIGLMKIETSHDKVGEYIKLQERSVHKLDLFIKEIMNLSRNSRLGITVSLINFKELIDEIFEGQNYGNVENEIVKTYNIEENISFYTDRSRLNVILSNLISNSLKYTNPNEKSVNIEINIYTEDEKCVLEVIDNGIGISDNYLPKIFEMFFRATDEFNGSGLGLYIVKETVEKLKGRITVRSKMRVGSTFRVVLPNLKERFEAAPKLDD